MGDYSKAGQDCPSQNGEYIYGCPSQNDGEEQNDEYIYVCPSHNDGKKQNDGAHT